MKLQQVKTPVNRKQQTMKGCINLKMDLYCRGSFPAHPGKEKQDANGTDMNILTGSQRS
ncbi:MAG: hypothetical protein QNL62_07825 [Gammaproteobacteria bacterium]|nr:hypothetical protein [Gammaproteobacteria bacterium]